MYITNIKNYCMDHTLTMNLYGSSILEQHYPDIYEDIYEDIDIDIDTDQYTLLPKMFVIIDLRTGLGKGTNIMLDRLKKYNIPIITNSNHNNNLVHERGLNKQSELPVLIDYEDMTIIGKYVDLEQLTHHNQIHTLTCREWVTKILDIII